MFFDYKDSVPAEAKEAVNKKEPLKEHEEFERELLGEWRRIKRPVYSRFWRAMHNLVAHPMLAICRPLGQKLHNWTAEKMYKKPHEGASPISQSD